MTPDDDAHPRRPQVLAATAAGVLVLLVMHLLLSADWIAASGVSFAAAQLVAQLCEPPSDDPPSDDRQDSNRRPAD